MYSPRYSHFMSDAYIGETDVSALIFRFAQQYSPTTGSVMLISSIAVEVILCNTQLNTFLSSIDGA